MTQRGEVLNRRRGIHRRRRDVQVFQMSDALWKHLEPLVPKRERKSKAGRPPVPARTIANAILYVLRTGCQWRALDKVEMGCSGSTAHEYFQEWLDADVFRRFWQQGLVRYDEVKGIDWSFLSVDGAITKAPLGGDATGPNPTDRAKSGTKRSIQTDAAGVPISVVVAGANRNDFKMLEETLDSIVVDRPSPELTGDQGLCLDKGYDYPESRQQVDERDYIPHIRSRGEELFDKKQQPQFRARRWVVERTHSWINRYRRLLIRWEKKVTNYVGLLQMACALIAFRAAGVP